MPLHLSCHRPLPSVRAGLDPYSPAPAGLCPPGPAGRHSIPLLLARPAIAASTLPSDRRCYTGSPNAASYRLPRAGSAHAPEKSHHVPRWYQRYLPARVSASPPTPSQHLRPVHPREHALHAVSTPPGPCCFPPIPGQTAFHTPLDCSIPPASLPPHPGLSATRRPSRPTIADQPCPSAPPGLCSRQNCPDNSR